MLLVCMIAALVETVTIEKALDRAEEQNNLLQEA